VSLTRAARVHPWKKPCAGFCGIEDEKREVEEKEDADACHFHAEYLAAVALDLQPGEEAKGKEPYHNVRCTDV